MIYILALLGVALAAHSPNHFDHQWQLGILVAVLVFAQHIRINTHALTALTWWLPATFATVQLHHPAFGRNSIGFLLAMFALPTIALTLKPKYLWQFFLYFLILDSAWIISGRPGFLGNPSLDATLLACLYVSNALMPQVHLPKGQFAPEWWMLPTLVELILPPIALLKSGSALAWPVAGVGLGIGLFRYSGPLWGILGVVIAGGSGGFRLGRSLLDDSGRFKVWSDALQFFKINAHPLLGFGPGSWREIIPRFQLSTGGDPKSLWTYAHNDFLQSLFETGLLGFGLLTLLYAELLRRSWERPWLFATWVSFGVACFFNPLGHMFFGALFGALLVRFTFLEEEKS